MPRRLDRILLVIVLACAGTGCAMAIEDNRRTLSWLNTHATPESTTGKVALAPLALPAGVTAFAADALLVHPAMVVDDAWGDTVELLWTTEDETRFRRVLLTPLAALATPFVFAGDWAGRALFAIPEREPEEER